MNRIILHVDFDSFFASVEQQYNPQFRNKPLAVTASNGRTAIIAASREAKALGIHGRDRTYKAFEKCPWLLLTQAHFTHYFEVSKKFLAIASQFAPVVELFSIDEVFMDVTGSVKLYGTIEHLVRLFKSRIKKEIGEYVTVSVGVSYNKMLAKMASGIQKPNGYTVITPDTLPRFYQSCSLTAICGIGERTARHLQRIGIYKLSQLTEYPLHKLVQEFGNVEGHFLKEVGLGIDDSEVITYLHAPKVKSVSRNYALPRNEYNVRIFTQNIYELCEEVSLKLRRLQKKSRTIGLSLRGLGNYYAHKTVSEFIDSGTDMFAICSQFLQEWHVPMVRMISVWAGNLVDASSSPLPLFEHDRKRAKVQDTIDMINEKFGDHTIRNGFLLYSDKLTTVPNGWMADKYERTKLAQETKF